MCIGLQIDHYAHILNNSFSPFWISASFQSSSPAPPPTSLASPSLGRSSSLHSLASCRSVQSQGSSRPIPGVLCGCHGGPRAARGCALSSSVGVLAAGSCRREGVGDPVPVALGLSAEVRVPCGRRHFLWSPLGLGFQALWPELSPGPLPRTLAARQFVNIDSSRPRRVHEQR